MRRNKDLNELLYVAKDVINIRTIKLKETYTALLLIDEFEAQLEELEGLKRRLLNKGTFNEKKLKKYTFRWIIVFLVFYFLLYLLANNFSIKKTLVLFPECLTNAILLACLLFLLIVSYNKIVRCINKFIFKKRQDRDWLYYEKNKEVIVSNLSTVRNSLKRSTIPEKYHQKEILELAINYLKVGRAFSEEHALYILETEHPELFNKVTNS